MEAAVLLYYRYIAVPDPEAERAEQLRVCREAGFKGRIIIGSEGINGTVAGPHAAVAAYRDYMDAHDLFSGINYKVDYAERAPFPKLKVKVRPEIVTLGASLDVKGTATHLSPTEFNELLTEPDVVLFDARNGYESAIGRFRGAVTPDIGLFSELPRALESYGHLKDKTVVAYCTGGIRCEKATALMREQGFSKVYQLDGGIINYAQQFPEGAFEGECFVFDERMSVAFAPNPALLGSCVGCEAATNRYINCHVKACNALIIRCQDCSNASSDYCPSCQLELTAALS